MLIDALQAEAEEPMPFPSPALVGAPGQEFVSTMLSTKEPATAIGEVQVHSNSVPLLFSNFS